MENLGLLFSKHVGDDEVFICTILSCISSRHFHSISYISRQPDSSCSPAKQPTRPHSSPNHSDSDLPHKPQSWITQEILVPGSPSLISEVPFAWAYVSSSYDASFLSNKSRVLEAHYGTASKAFATPHTANDELAQSQQSKREHQYWEETLVSGVACSQRMTVL